MSIIDLVLDLPQKLQELVEVLQTWIFEGISIGGYTVSFWGLLGGVLITALIIYSIIRS